MNHAIAVFFLAAALSACGTIGGTVSGAPVPIFLVSENGSKSNEKDSNCTSRGSCRGHYWM